MSTINIDHLLAKVQKPGRYIGKEINSIVKDKNHVEYNMVFAFPDFYEIGMSYVGMQILYSIVNSHEGMAMERTFAPDFDMENLMREEGVSLFSLETKTPLREFDVVGFTLQYEMSYTTVLNMMDMSMIPLFSVDREDTMPIVIAGGPCAQSPEPMADFFDIFFVGDGEESMVEFAKLFIRLKKEGKNKKQIIRAAAHIRGAYVPSAYSEENNDDISQGISIQANDSTKLPTKIRPAIVASIEKVKYPTKPLVPIVEIVQDRGVVETFRGCTRGCRFCQAGIISRPVRERSKENILQICKDIIENTGHEELSLLSLSTSDYSQFEPLVSDLMDFCGEKNVSLSLPSLRLDSFSFNVLEKIQKYKKSGLTFAPEAGTQRLRNVINKSITDDHIFDSISKAMDLGWKQVKLYFMIGLPTETDEDLEGIKTIATNILDIYSSKGLGGRFQVNISVSNFVPKPHTPFQWEPQDTEVEFVRKHNYLRNILNIRGVSFSYHDASISVLECLLAKGDRKVGKLIKSAFEKGCKLDGWSEHFRGDLWKQAILEWEENEQVKASDYTSKRGRHEDVLPWDIIDTFVAKEFLIAENMKALEGVITQDCRKDCLNCNFSGENDTDQSTKNKDKGELCPNIQ